ncbi:MAG: hypothetical protein Q7S07_02890 [Candidatus Omnitrophota bacterium]|nr:hypothetical protein [Candidatus Omnitrophota bacterium]
MRGYQFLENDFFELCQTREIGHTPMLLYIYLRGLFCRFQKPIFTWQDKQTRQHLGISQSTLLRAREYLQTRGMMTFMSGRGNRHTEYTMLGTVLLPVIKKTTGCRHAQPTRYRQNDDTCNTSKEKLKNIVGNIFQGMNDKDREFLKEKGIY